MLQNDDKIDEPANTATSGRVVIWRRIADSLKADILSGRMQPGGQLPTESVLAERFSVNRHTVRRALSALTSDGYIEATRGRGTFVAEHPIHYPIGSRTRFSEIVSGQALQPGGRLISSAIVAANAALAERLGIAEGEPLIRLEVLRVADSVPVTVGTLWFIAARVPNLINDYAETGTITKALEKAGFGDYRRQASWITTMIADGEDRRHLKLGNGAPVLVVESLNISADGQPLQFSRARFAGGAVQLVIES